MARDNNNNNTKTQGVQKRTRTFDSPEEVRKELAQTVYNLQQFSADDIASAFGVTRQTLSWRNRQKLKKDRRVVGDLIKKHMEKKGAV